VDVDSVFPLASETRQLSTDSQEMASSGLVPSASGEIPGAAGGFAVPLPSSIQPKEPAVPGDDTVMEPEMVADWGGDDESVTCIVKV
jgi:hypothetical protein